MDCKSCQERLVEYSDGELTRSHSAECDAVRSHLDGCSLCRGRFEELQALRVMVRRELDFTAPAGLKERILSDAEAGGFHSAKGEWTSENGVDLYKPKSLESRPAWLSRLDLGWLKPAIGMAAVLAVAFIIPRFTNFTGPADDFATFSKPGDVVALRYGESPIRPYDPETGGLNLSSPL